MTKLQFFLTSVFVAMGVQTIAFAQNVLEDAGVGLSYEELAYSVSRWTPQMQQAAADDLGDRLELLTVALANKRIAAEAEKLTPETDGDAYWDYLFSVRAVQRKFVMDRFAETIEIPDMAPLAAERYQTQKEKYALEPERRISSHILFSCPPGSCPREEAKAKAQVVLDKLHAGADFGEMVREYSDDPGTREKGGLFDKWIAFAEPQVERRYSDGVFEIDEVGDYSELVSSKFGIHIIRLDGIRESFYQPLKKVEDKITADLRQEYRRLALKEFLTQFNISDEAYIDNAAMEKIFSKYKDAAVAEADESGS